MKVSLPDLVGSLLAKVLGETARFLTKEGHIRVLVVRRMVPSRAIAQTWGRTVLVLSSWYRRASYDELTETMAHELVHVDQWRKVGMAFLLLYPLASLAALVRGKHPYWDNKYEKEARALAPMKYKEGARIALEISPSPYLK